MSGLLQKLRNLKNGVNVEAGLEESLIELNVDYKSLNAEYIYQQLFKRYENLYSLACTGWLESKADRNFTLIGKLLNKPT